MPSPKKTSFVKMPSFLRRKSRTSSQSSISDGSVSPQSNNSITQNAASLTSSTGKPSPYYISIGREDIYALKQPQLNQSFNLGLFGGVGLKGLAQRKSSRKSESLPPSPRMAMVLDAPTVSQEMTSRSSSNSSLKSAIRWCSERLTQLYQPNKPFYDTADNNANSSNPANSMNYVNPESAEIVTSVASHSSIRHSKLASMIDDADADFATHFVHPPNLSQALNTTQPKPLTISDEFVIFKTTQTDTSSQLKELRAKLNLPIKLGDLSKDFEQKIQILTDVFYKKQPTGQQVLTKNARELKQLKELLLAVLEQHIKQLDHHTTNLSEKLNQAQNFWADDVAIIMAKFAINEFNNLQAKDVHSGTKFEPTHFKEKNDEYIEVEEFSDEATAGMTPSEIEQFDHNNILNEPKNQPQKLDDAFKTLLLPEVLGKLQYRKHRLIDLKETTPKTNSLEYKFGELLAEIEHALNVEVSVNTKLSEIAEKLATFHDSNLEKKFNQMIEEIETARGLSLMPHMKLDEVLEDIEVVDLRENLDDMMIYLQTLSPMNISPAVALIKGIDDINLDLDLENRSKYQNQYQNQQVEPKVTVQESQNNPAWNEDSGASTIIQPMN